MSRRNIHLLLKIFFSGFMLFAAAGELPLNKTVVHSMHVIDMPVYLLYLLGTAKILGLVALWHPRAGRLKEWAFAGFTFDFVGAIYGFVFTGNFILPDIVMAPLALMICLSLYYTQEKLV